METHQTRSAGLLDELEVRSVCMRYWAGWDRRDLGHYLTAFTPDAKLSFYGGKFTSTVSEIAAKGKIDIPFTHTSHSPGSQIIRVDGDKATADTFVLCHLICPDGKVLIRGLRYLDDLVRTEEGWRITYRQHFDLWQYDAQSVEPHV